MISKINPISIFNLYISIIYIHDFGRSTQSPYSVKNITLNAISISVISNT